MRCRPPAAAAASSVRPRTGRMNPRAHVSSGPRPVIDTRVKGLKTHQSGPAGRAPPILEEAQRMLSSERTVRGTWPGPWMALSRRPGVAWSWPPYHLVGPPPRDPPVSEGPWPRWVCARPQARAAPAPPRPPQGLGLRLLHSRLRLQNRSLASFPLCLSGSLSPLFLRTTAVGSGAHPSPAAPQSGSPSP